MYDLQKVFGCSVSGSGVRPIREITIQNPSGGSYCVHHLLMDENVFDDLNAAIEACDTWMGKVDLLHAASHKGLIKGDIMLSYNAEGQLDERQCCYENGEMREWVIYKDGQVAVRGNGLGELASYDAMML